ncbi:hypothetical protein [Streptomyces sp. H23]|uniref:hypothetical protein n=1 Tax=Streptomyces TaxID=1883 RepID=UPI001F10A9D5|nr:hypothetical protein [Streptomyces sp. H23]
MRSTTPALGAAEVSNPAVYGWSPVISKTVRPGADGAGAGGVGATGTGPCMRVPSRAASTAAATDTSRPSDVRWEPAATICSVCRAIPRGPALTAPPPWTP